MNLVDRFKGCLIGLAIGDAVGTSVEFMPRGSFDPVTDMTGGGFFDLPVGYWTDDTSMALCLGQSLLDCRGFNATHQLQLYSKWYYDGYMSSTGECFDIGETTRLAIERFQRTKKPYCGSSKPSTSGNGGLMRLAPVAMAYYDPIDICGSSSFAMLSSKTTHASKECLDCASYLSMMISAAMEGIILYDPVVTKKKIDDIKGSGRAKESLEAAYWCVWNSNSFEETILKAVNLGDDADTTAAIAGQIAGALYGIDGIGSMWLQKLHQRDMIESMAVELFELNKILKG